MVKWIVVREQLDTRSLWTPEGSPIAVLQGVARDTRTRNASYAMTVGENNYDSEQSFFYRAVSTRNIG